MNSLKKYFYVGRGKADIKPWLFYGTNPPIFLNDEICSCAGCKLIGQFPDNPIGDSIKDGEIIKIYIRKENKKKQL